MEGSVEKRNLEKSRLEHNYRKMNVEELTALQNDPDVSKNQKKKIKKQLDWLSTESMEKRRIARQLKKDEMKKSKEQYRRQKEEGTLDVDFQPPLRKRQKCSKVKTTSNFSELQHLAIDCSFNDLMANKDIKKLAGQISWCYKVNRRSREPVQYHLLGMEDRLSSDLDPSFQNWDLHYDEGLSQFETKDICYLVAESPNVLEDVKPGVLYVIGGLVDHNHHKGHCFELAKKKGYQTARLPLTENVDMKTRRVLTVNHVFEMMIARRELGSWKDAILKVLPSRKIESVKEKQEDKSGTGEKQPEEDQPHQEEKAAATVAGGALVPNAVAESAAVQRAATAVEGAEAVPLVDLSDNL